MPYFLTKDELTRILQEALKADPLHHLLFLVSYRHGLRVSEVAKLTAFNIVFGDMVKVQRLKHSKLTTQTLVEKSDVLWDEKSALLARAQEVPLGFPFFPSPSDCSVCISRFQVRRLVQRYGRRAGIHPTKLRGLHVMKHTCGSHIIPAGIHITMEHLGHKDIKSTQVYLHVDPVTRQREVERAMGV